MRFYTGSYTEALSETLQGGGSGISFLEYDEEQALFQSKGYVYQRNPSYLAIHPDKQAIYAPEEASAGDHPKVYSYKMQPDGTLQVLNAQPILGEYTCHAQVVGEYLLLANYGSGNINVFPIADDGSLMPMCDEVTHSGSGPNRARQEGPHAHMIFQYLDELVYIVDLGIDLCKAYHLIGGKLIPVPTLDLPLNAGSGPRHMEKHPTLPVVYVLNELSGQLATFYVKEDHVTRTHQQHTIPDVHQPSCAAIKMHPSGKYLYTSDRETSSISQFSVNADGIPALVMTHQIKDQVPRDFAINATGEKMIIAGQNSNSLSVYQISEEGALLWISSMDQFIRPSCIKIIAN